MKDRDQRPRHESTKREAFYKYLARWALRAISAPLIIIYAKRRGKFSLHITLDIVLATQTPVDTPKIHLQFSNAHSSCGADLDSAASRHRFPFELLVGYRQFTTSTAPYVD